jgi:hypothetical protein
MDDNARLAPWDACELGGGELRTDPIFLGGCGHSTRSPINPPPERRGCDATRRGDCVCRFGWASFRTGAVREPSSGVLLGPPISSGRCYAQLPACATNCPIAKRLVPFDERGGSDTSAPTPPRCGATSVTSLPPPGVDRRATCARSGRAYAFSRRRLIVPPPTIVRGGLTSRAGPSQGVRPSQKARLLPVFPRRSRRARPVWFAAAVLRGESLTVIQFVTDYCGDGPIRPTGPGQVDAYRGAGRTV